MRPGRSQIAPDRRGLLADRVVAAVAGLARDDGGDQLERRQHRPPAPRVGAGLALPAGAPPAPASLCRARPTRGPAAPRRTPPRDCSAGSCARRAAARPAPAPDSPLARRRRLRLPVAVHRPRASSTTTPPHRPPRGVYAGRRGAVPRPGDAAGPPHPCWKCPGRATAGAGSAQLEYHLAGGAPSVEQLECLARALEREARTDDRPNEALVH